MNYEIAIIISNPIVNADDIIKALETKYDNSSHISLSIFQVPRLSAIPYTVKLLSSYQKYSCIVALGTFENQDMSDYQEVNHYCQKLSLDLTLPVIFECINHSDNDMYTAIYNAIDAGIFMVNTTNKINIQHVSRLQESSGKYCN